jgi:hypothetical protein
VFNAINLVGSLLGDQSKKDYWEIIRINVLKKTRRKTIRTIFKSLIYEDIKLSKETMIINQTDKVVTSSLAPVTLPETQNMLSNGFSDYTWMLDQVDKISSLSDIWLLTVNIPKEQACHKNFMFQVMSDDFNTKNEIDIFSKERIKGNNRIKYQEYIANILIISGLDVNASQKFANTIVELEINLDNIWSGNNNTTEDHSSFALSISDLKLIVPKIDIGLFFEKGDDAKMIENWKRFKYLSELLNSTSIDILKAYLKFHILDTAAPTLSEAFRKASACFKSFLEASIAVHTFNSCKRGSNGIDWLKIKII